MENLANPLRLYTRTDVLLRPCPVPAMSGGYAWFFKEIPRDVPLNGCIDVDNMVLLYVGISPDKIAKPNSKQNLRKRITNHYRGNAAGSTLRRTLGVLLACESGYPLRRVGSGKRMTFTHAGEQYLDRWMEKNALVCWLAHAEPWKMEQQLLHELSCPLNIKDNLHHPFSSVLKKLRTDAIQRARQLPIADERGQSRRE